MGKMINGKLGNPIILADSLTVLIQYDETGYEVNTKIAMKLHGVLI